MFTFPSPASFSSLSTDLPHTSASTLHSSPPILHSSLSQHSEQTYSEGSSTKAALTALQREVELHPVQQQQLCAAATAATHESLEYGRLMPLQQHQIKEHTSLVPKPSVFSESVPASSVSFAGIKYSYSYEHPHSRELEQKLLAELQKQSSVQPVQPKLGKGLPPPKPPPPKRLTVQEKWLKRQQEQASEAEMPLAKNGEEFKKVRSEERDSETVAYKEWIEEQQQQQQVQIESILRHQQELWQQELVQQLTRKKLPAPVAVMDPSTMESRENVTAAGLEWPPLPTFSSNAQSLVWEPVFTDANSFVSVPYSSSLPKTIPHKPLPSFFSEAQLKSVCSSGHDTPETEQEDRMKELMLMMKSGLASLEEETSSQTSRETQFYPAVQDLEASSSSSSGGQVDAQSTSSSLTSSNYKSLHDEGASSAPDVLLLPTDEDHSLTEIQDISVNISKSDSSGGGSSPHGSLSPMEFGDAIEKICRIFEKCTKYQRPRMREFSGRPSEADPGGTASYPSLGVFTVEDRQSASISSSGATFFTDQSSSFTQSSNDLRVASQVVSEQQQTSGSSSGESDRSEPGDGFVTAQSRPQSDVVSRNTVQNLYLQQQQQILLLQKQLEEQDVPSSRNATEVKLSLLPESSLSSNFSTPSAGNGLSSSPHLSNTTDVSSLKRRAPMPPPQLPTQQQMPTDNVIAVSKELIAEFDPVIQRERKHKTHKIAPVPLVEEVGVRDIARNEEPRYRKKKAGQRRKMSRASLEAKQLRKSSNGLLLGDLPRASRSTERPLKTVRVSSCSVGRGRRTRGPAPPRPPRPKSTPPHPSTILTTAPLIVGSQQLLSVPQQDTRQTTSSSGEGPPGHASKNLSSGPPMSPTSASDTSSLDSLESESDSDQRSDEDSASESDSETSSDEESDGESGSSSASSYDSSSIESSPNIPIIDIMLALLPV